MTAADLVTLIQSQGSAVALLVAFAVAMVRGYLHTDPEYKAVVAGLQVRVDEANNRADKAERTAEQWQMIALAGTSLAERALVATAPTATISRRSQGGSTAP